MREEIKVAWISAGVSSLIAAYITPDIDKLIYIDIDDQHPDSMRFLKDCEKVLNKPIEILKSHLGSVDNAIRQSSFITLRNGAAACTNMLKKRVRKEWEYEHRDYALIYIWGLDCNERERVEGILKANCDVENEFPLITNNLTKQDCHGMCERLGVKRPIMYDLGYSNNNCIGCVKGGMGYWNKIRKDFPDVFKRRAELERLIGHSCLKDDNGAVFLDELNPDRGNMSNEIMSDCSLFCELAIINPVSTPTTPINPNGEVRRDEV